MHPKLTRALTAFLTLAVVLPCLVCAAVAMPAGDASANDSDDHYAKIDIPSSRFDKWEERIAERIEDPDLTLRDFAEIADLDPKDQPMVDRKLTTKEAEDLFKRLTEESEAKNDTKIDIPSSRFDKWTES